MRHVSNRGFIAANVLIDFVDGSVCLHIPPGATLADISEKLDNLAKWHRGEPLSIGVRFEVPNGGSSARGRAHPPGSSPISDLGGAEQCGQPPLSAAEKREVS